MHCVVLIIIPDESNCIIDISIQIIVFQSRSLNLPWIDDDVFASSRRKCIEQYDHPQPKGEIIHIQPIHDFKFVGMYVCEQCLIESTVVCTKADSNNINLAAMQKIMTMIIIIFSSKSSTENPKNNRILSQKRRKMIPLFFVALLFTVSTRSMHRVEYRW